MGVVRYFWMPHQQYSRPPGIFQRAIIRQLISLFLSSEKLKSAFRHGTCKHQKAKALPPTVYLALSYMALSITNRTRTHRMPQIQLRCSSKFTPSMLKRVLAAIKTSSRCSAKRGLDSRIGGCQMFWLD